MTCPRCQRPVTRATHRGETVELVPLDAKLYFVQPLAGGRGLSCHGVPNRLSDRYRAAVYAKHECSAARRDTNPGSTDAPMPAGRGQLSLGEKA
jgi:hypothetical protein